jgi:hypothetical protein
VGKITLKSALARIEELEAQTVTYQESLKKAHQRVIKSRAMKDAMVGAVYAAATESRLAQPPLPKPPRLTVKPGKSHHVALLHTTDWQAGKITPTYSLEVLECRLNTMMDVAAVLNRRHGNPVESCYLLLGGDMLEGVSIFPTQPFEIEAEAYDQFFAVVRLIRMVIDRALAIWPFVYVVSKWGNHGRIGKFGELPDTDNLDRMAYRVAWERYQDDPRVYWDVENKDYVQQFDIGNYRAALLHGNEFHKTFSAERIVRKLTAWQTMYGFGDAYLGHFHRRDCYGMPNGSMAYFTGSTESSNAYAADQLAARTDPTQRLHFIDPDRGRVNAEHVLWL